MSTIWDHESILERLVGVEETPVLLDTAREEGGGEKVTEVRTGFENDAA